VLKAPEEWAGAYTLISGSEWGAKPGIDIQKMLNLNPNDVVTLRFKARSDDEAVVAFLTGGVTAGKFPSSLRFPVKVENSPVRLSKDFTEYSIRIEAKRLTNVIDPFAVTVTALDNPGKKRVRFQVTDIRFESPRVPRKDASLDWREHLSRNCWIAYTPTGFNPTSKPIQRAQASEIRADLKALGKLLDQADIKDRGLVLYGCRDGLEEIPAVAAEENFTTILGIFLPRDTTEVANAEKLLKQKDLEGTIVACCVGNEAMTFRRANTDEIIAVADRLRKVRKVPMTTTEIIQEYGNKHLVQSFDFAFPNAHALFAGVNTPQAGAKWACDRLRDLQKTLPADIPILVKEFGWVNGPAPTFDAKQQRDYWLTIFADPVARKVNIALFDGLENTPWKREMLTISGDKKVDIGSHWAILLDAQRRPKPHALEIVGAWKKTRS
jgi:exo-beta-1,3-glucanase (GH17 family)